VAILDPFFWPQWEERAQIRGEEAAFASLMRGNGHVRDAANQVVIMPMHWPAHWNGSVVYPGRGRVFIMDTIANDHSRRATDQRLRRALGRFWPEVQGWQLQHKEVWQQEDGSSCGPGLIINVAHELGVVAEAMQTWDGQEDVLRYHLAQILAAHFRLEFL
jgi:hypothetical protein